MTNEIQVRLVKKSDESPNAFEVTEVHLVRAGQYETSGGGYHGIAFNPQPERDLTPYMGGVFRARYIKNVDGVDEVHLIR